MAETEKKYVRPTMEELLKDTGNRSGVSRMQDGSDPKAEIEDSNDEEEGDVDGNTVPKDKTDKDGNKSEDQKQKDAEDKQVPLEALHEARLKNRELRSKMSKLEQELSKTKDSSTEDYYNYNQPDQKVDKSTDVMNAYREDKFHQTIGQVKREHKNFTEVFEKFDKLCDENDQTRAEGDISLWDQMYHSSDPGHFIVDHVEQSEMVLKYGNDPKTMKNKVRAELEKEITEKVTGDLRKKYNIKETMPTDISGSRAASGGHTPYNRPSAQSLWDTNKFGNRKKE